MSKKFGIASLSLSNFLLSFLFLLKPSIRPAHFLCIVNCCCCCCFVCVRVFVLMVNRLHTPLQSVPPSNFPSPRALSPACVGNLSFADSTANEIFSSLSLLYFLFYFPSTPTQHLFIRIYCCLPQSIDKIEEVARSRSKDDGHNKSSI